VIILPGTRHKRNVFSPWLELGSGLCLKRRGFGYDVSAALSVSRFGWFCGPRNGFPDFFPLGLAVPWLHRALAAGERRRGGGMLLYSEVEFWFFIFLFVVWQIWP